MWEETGAQVFLPEKLRSKVAVVELSDLSAFPPTSDFGLLLLRLLQLVLCKMIALCFMAS